MTTPRPEKIDYSFPRLLYFDSDVHAPDASLKQHEHATLLQLLRTTGRLHSTHSYLDIGTCTGRYPFALQPLLPPQAHIAGLDADADCIAYCNAQKRIRSARGESMEGMHFTHADFLHYQPLPGERYQLITCMLGTIAHLYEQLPPEQGIDAVLVRL